MLLNEDFKPTNSVLDIGNYAYLIREKQQDLCELIKNYIEICGYFCSNEKPREVQFLSLDEKIVVLFCLIPSKRLTGHLIIFTVADKDTTKEEMGLYKIAFSSAAMILSNYEFRNEEAEGKGKSRKSSNEGLSYRIMNQIDNIGKKLVDKTFELSFKPLDSNYIAVFELRFNDSSKTLSDIKKKANEVFSKTIKDQSFLLITKGSEWTLLISFSEDVCKKDMLHKKGIQRNIQPPAK